MNDAKITGSRVIAYKVYDRQAGQAVASFRARKLAWARQNQLNRACGDPDGNRYQVFAAHIVYDYDK